MPNFSAKTAANVEDLGPVVDHNKELDGYTGSFLEMRETVDMTPILAGLPGGHCSCPHWGYVIEGQWTVKYADREEVFEAGDAFYMSPGHVPVEVKAGTKTVMFSPTEELVATDNAIKSFFASQTTA